MGRCVCVRARVCVCVYCFLLLGVQVEFMIQGVGFALQALGL